MTWPCGKKYRGQWENGVMSGRGVFTFDEGKVYYGNYANDKRNG